MKISYEINTYKKVSASGFYIIPRGKKCIVWLTVYKGAQEAIFFDLDPRDHSKIKFVSIRAIHPSQQFHFDDFQGSGTVLYGTLFNHGPGLDQQQFFAVENIHVYENACVDHLNVVQKDELLYTLFSKSGLTRAVNARAPAHVQVVFGVAVKCGTYAEALKVANTPSIVPYSVYAIQGRFHTQTDNKYYQNCQSQGGDKYQGGGEHPLKPPYTDSNTFPQGGGGERPLRSASEPLYTDSKGGGKLFMVSPQPLVDTYTLRCPVTNAVEPEPAHVGDYKTSVLLNSIFRTVRENASLDAAEESEDEEAFQASQQMHIEGYISSSSAPERAMICTYNYKFKRWVPLRLGPIPGSSQI
jgi:hypothetical protein